MQTVNFSSLEEQYIGGNIYQFWRLRVWYLWSFITYKEILVIGKAKSWVSDFQVWSLYRLLSFRNQCHWIMVLSVYYCNSKQWWVASSVKYQSDLSKFYLIYVFVFSCDYLNFHTWCLGYSDCGAYLWTKWWHSQAELGTRVIKTVHF